MKNVGGVPACWNFVFPNDNEVEIDPWADPGEPSPEEATEKHILDSNIFQIEPRTGCLEPGEQTDLNFYY